MDRELFYSDNDRFLNYGDLFCDEEWEQKTRIMHNVDQVLLENSEFGRKVDDYWRCRWYKILSIGK